MNVKRYEKWGKKVDLSSTFRKRKAERENLPFWESKNGFVHDCTAYLLPFSVHTVKRKSIFSVLYTNVYCCFLFIIHFSLVLFILFNYRVLFFYYSVVSPKHFTFQFYVPWGFIDFFLFMYLHRFFTFVSLKRKTQRCVVLNFVHFLDFGFFMWLLWLF